ncbi:MAG: hypothetical protein IT247_08800 [Bacteroidia bacterium]|nr:hypothetical protein [Bacteroidia bacterium]
MSYVISGFCFYSNTKISLFLNSKNNSHSANIVRLGGLFLLYFFFSLATQAQQHNPSFLHNQGGWQLHPADSHFTFTGVDDEREHPKHEDLETELEIYPFNMVVPDDPVIKNEAMFDYHKHSKSGKMLGGIRFFADANTHWAKARDMKDLILYTELYYGFKHFQLGGETGSITGEEFMTLGPQFTLYDSKIFKRVSLISRVLPDYVFGYEYTTQEAHFLHGMTLSSTGMGRIVTPANKAIIQASAWVSFKGLRGVYFGIEYEHNNSKYFNTHKFEVNDELFLGIKAELH